MGAGLRFFGSASTLSALIVSLAVAGVLPVTLAPAAAETGTPEVEQSSLSLSQIFPDPQLLSNDVIAALNVDPYRLGIDELITARVQLGTARREMSDAMYRFSESSEAIATGLVLEAETLAGFEVASEEAVAAEANLKDFAVGAFSGSELRDLEGELLSGKLNPQLTLQDHAENRVLDVKSRTDSALVVATAQLASARQELSTQREAQSVAEFDLAQAQQSFDLASGQIEEFGPSAEVRLAIAKDPELGFSVVALNAYYNAELVMAEADPKCGVQWWQLAGIGRVESIHGTHGTSKLKSTGVTTRRILGPPLDGEEFLAIPDSDGGKLDGDLVWDRAVGPMQFIPGSWRIFKADGNSDGDSDPHSMYDATVAAAKHLCNSVRNMTNSGRFRRALLDYNRSAEYGATVQRFAVKYAKQIDLVAPANPTPEQKTFCLPKPNEIDSMPLSGCGAVGRAAGGA